MCRLAVGAAMPLFVSATVFLLLRLFMVPELLSSRARYSEAATYLLTWLANVAIHILTLPRLRAWGRQ